MAKQNQRRSENVRQLIDFEKLGSVNVSSLCEEEEVKMIGCPKCGHSHIVRKTVNEAACNCGAVIKIKKRWFER